MWKGSKKERKKTKKKEKNMKKEKIICDVLQGGKKNKRKERGQCYGEERKTRRKVLEAGTMRSPNWENNE